MYLSVQDMSFMFMNPDLIQTISNWDVSNVTNMDSMFKHSIFNGDITELECI